MISLANKLATSAVAAIASMTPTKSAASSDANNTDSNVDPNAMELEASPSSNIDTNSNTNTSTTTSTSSIEPQQQDANNTASTSSPVKSILKPGSLSLEPKDLRARAKSNTNTPRKVQFTVVDGEYGGRGKTEFTRCPSRKSHTRRPLPPGHFDTDSDSTAGQSDNDSVGYNNGDNYSLLDTLNSQKFCQNSRLIKLVRRKKRKLAKEQRWLAMVSPTVTNNNGNKTMSRMNVNNNSNAQNITNNAQNTQNTQTQNAATENAINNTMNSLLSMKVPNRNQNRMNKQNAMNAAINTTNARFKSPYKSPSASMSRGRRALYKAQKAQQNRMNKANNNGKPQKIQNTPIVKGTPIVQKVTKIAAMRMASLDQINEDNGNDADNDNDIDDDIMMNTNNNNGSVPPQDMINNANTKKTSSELITTHETNEERKDNSHENSPKQAEPASNPRDDDMEDAETLSDEMKTDEKTGNSLDIAYEDDEDDDLILDDLRNGTSGGATKSGPTSTKVSVSITSPKPVPTPIINSLFMPKNKSDVTQDDDGRNMTNSNRNSIKSNHNPNPTENNTANRVQEERDETMGMQSKSPSQDPQQLNFNLTSPMRSEPEIIVPASPQMIQQSTSTSTSTSTTLSMGSKMSPMDFAQRTSGRQIISKNRNSSYLEQHSFSVGLGSSSYSRSIATQTERVPCEIGIQVDMSIDNMHSMADIPYVVMKDAPKKIITSSGAVFQRIYPVVNDEKEPEAEADVELQRDHANHYGSVSESENENDDDVIMDENEIKDKSQSPSNEPQLVNENNVENEISLQAQPQRMEVVPQRELSPVIEEEPESNEKEATPSPTQKELESKEKATAIQTEPEVDIVSNATEASETEKSNETPPPEQRLQSLSLNIQNAAPIPVPVNDENLGLNAQITNNNNTKKDRSHLKRKYDEALENNDDDTTERNADDELSKEPTPIKRRKVNNIKKVKRTNSEQRIKYQKKDIVWTMDEYQTMHPTLILTCFYDPNERFYPSGYEILWLPYIDLEGPRNGKCSLTEEPYFNIKSRVSDKDLDQRIKYGEGFVDAAWNEIKTHRPDIYRKYKDSRGRLRSTKPKKIKRKRRASVM